MTDGIGLIDTAQDTNLWRALVKAVMNFRFPYSCLKALGELRKWSLLKKKEGCLQHATYAEI
jgi:hypothetical protein